MRNIFAAVSLLVLCLGAPPGAAAVTNDTVNSSGTMLEKLVDTLATAAITNVASPSNGTKKISSTYKRLLENSKNIEWHEVGEKLFLSEISSLPAGNNGEEGQENKKTFVLLKIDPKYYSFHLMMSSEDGENHSLHDWAEKYDLIAAINASMYLPDKKTSTGHMQSATHVNNAKIGKKLGAFFFAEPLEDKSGKLPYAAITSLDAPDFKSLFNSYSLRVQNFRLLNQKGDIPWKETGAEHSIAAIGMDASGYVYFIFFEGPMTIRHFAELLRHSSIPFQNVMYVEGSDKAGILLRKSIYGKLDEQLWFGRKTLLNLRGDPDTKLPNIIGIKKRRQS